MWAIWCARRRAIHEEEFQAPLSTHAFVTRFMADVVDSRIKNRQLKKAGGRILVPSICWTPPATGVAKIHADGGLSKDRQVGAAAAVCRNDQGIFQGASAVVQAGMTDPEALEAQSICEAMALAADLQVSRVLIISDCLSVIKNINSGNRMTAYGAILKEVDRRKDSFQMVSIDHERRESNRDAHALAKYAASLRGGRHVWFTEPPDPFCIPVNINMQ